ncbi:hypothetical protein ACHQM5_016908 [Ranunculus cassubicifolius]
MAKIHGFKYVVGLLISVAVNIILLYNQFAHQEKDLSWSRAAAIEAEAVASISCSGHGLAYLDGVPSEDGDPKCECNSCYMGKDCSQFKPNCPADVDSGDPFFLEPFWLQNAENSAIVVAGWHRMSYTFEDKSGISKELEKHIRELHAVTGNAVTDGRFILFGAGSTQLIYAAVHSLSPEDSTLSASVVATPPFYALYKAQPEYFKSTEFKWKGNTSLWKNNSDYSGNFIEFVTSPNNPDGKLNKPVLQGLSSKTIFDHAYYWPHFSAIPKSSDEDVMIFTLSKLTGHAGTRFGWALIKDEETYKRMQMFILLNSMSISRDVQLRALKLLKVAVKDRGRGIFEFGYRKMRNRWERLSRSLSTSTRFSLQKLDPQFCTYFQNVTGPSPAYAWLKCEREEDRDCSEVLKTAGIIGRGGSIFSDDSRYVRLSLIKREDDFELLLQRLDALVSEENGLVYI